MRAKRATRDGVPPSPRTVQTERVDYLPLNGKPIRLTLGLRALDMREWIEVDAHRPNEMRQKQELLRSKHDEIVAHLPEGDEGSRELWDVLTAHVVENFPELHTDVEHEDSRIVALTDAQTGERVDARAMHPIDACGRIVQEDVVVMRRLNGEWRLVAASVCFPSRWRLSDKVGKGLGAIHAPVPGYEGQIARPVEAMFDKISVEHPMWRLNWTLIDDAALHQPESASRWRDPHALDAELAAADLGQTLHFRVERQTLVRLPHSDDIVFTIRTYVRSLAEIGSDRPGAYADLAIALRSAEPEFIAYKGWGPLLTHTLAWLDARS